VIAVKGRRPTQTGFTRWTGGNLSLPVQDEMLSGKAGLGAGLPVIIGAGRPHKLNAIAFTTADQVFRFD